MHALPSATTCGLPLSGAARKSTPARAVAARTCAETSAETVEQSTTTDGRRSADSSPAFSLTTSSRSSGVDTMTKTTSQAARSTIEPTAVAPRSTSGPVLAAVRFQTVSG